MSKPYDETHLRACLAVLAEAIVAARLMARRAQVDAPAGSREALEQIASLLDAVHNLPKFALRDDDDFRSWAYDRMKDFDEKAERPYLTLIYDQERAGS